MIHFLKCTIIIILLLMSAVAWAQPEPELLWTKDFYARENIRTEMRFDRKGNVLLFTGQLSLEPIGGYALMKYDTTGQLLWLNTYDEFLWFPHYNNAWTLDTSDQVYVGFHNGFGDDLWPYYVTIVKYTADGDKDWEMRLDSLSPGNQFIAEMEMDSLGRLIAFMRYQVQSNDTIFAAGMQMVCIDPTDRTVVWSKMIPGYAGPSGLEMTEYGIQYLYVYYDPVTFEVRHAIELMDYDGNIISTGNGLEDPYQSDYHYISKTGEVLFGSRAMGFRALCLDANADTVWVYNDGTNVTWPNNIVDFEMDDQKNTYLTGSSLFDSVRYMAVVKVAIDGSVLWTKRIGSEQKSSSGYAIAIDSTYCYVTGVTSPGHPDYTLLLSILDKQTGASVWDFEQSESNRYWGWNITAREKVIAYVGIWNPLDDASLEYLRTSYMRIPALTSQTYSNPNVALEIQPYPNPASEVLHIDQIDPKMFNQATLIDMKGGVVLESAINQSEIQINIGHLPQGTYTLVLSGSLGRLSRQVIKS